MILKRINDVGLAMRQARQERKLTQKQLAVKLGTNQEWISQFETGRLENPSLGTVLKAMAILGVNLSIDSFPKSVRDESLDTGDLALDEPSFLKGPGR
ncbi:helix-turn-helix transcriptional regulator [Bradyrhizobium sp. Pear77]|uniref:helix-turn-helix domain-containing protein n=1 Tax=Bradyrhizobium TaxID=374 RepID=UPI001E623C9B|nr:MULTISPECIES: helix-turn-helix transcriptional regulator [Bradyrhizobium]MCC8960101.1 helix-turn-helix transcriptional regulator [Bradyrhizobium altum]MCC8968454.1 helix-turn-helix transcriptional regulator [Bradyrhizobium oropedii]